MGFNQEHDRISAPEPTFPNTGAGLGVARLPLIIAAGAVQAGQLAQVLAGWSAKSAPVHAVFPSSRYLSPKVRAFIDHALQCIKDEPLPQ